MKLSSPFGGNKFCGPLVLSMISGKSTDECSLLASKSGHPLKAMYRWQMADSLTKLGVRFEKFKGVREKKADYRGFFKHPTLGIWARDYRRPSDMSAVYVVEITGHFVLIKGDQIADTYTRGVWTLISQYPRKSSHVNGFYKILDEVEV